MHCIQRLAVAGALSMLAACASPPPAPPSEPVVSYSDGVLAYDGELRADSVARIKAVMGERKVSLLRISSVGGEVDVSIAIARWVYANDIDVEVDGPCFSSCANYIFPAGRRKIIGAEGVVGWHGTLEHLLYKHEQNLQPVEERLLPSLRQTAELERAFFADTGINGFIGWFGKMAPYNVPNMYFMSADDMAYFGLRGLQVRDDYAATAGGARFKGKPEFLQMLVVDRAVTNRDDPRWHKPAAR